jgi:hypothetical protein
VRNLVVAALLGGGLAALTVSCVAPPGAAGRLMLSNFSFEPTAVQAVLAAGPDCAIGDPGATSEFMLPPNGTRVIPVPPGFDVCWRHELIGGNAAGGPPTNQWTAWSRAYTGSGRFLDAVVEIPTPPNAVVAAVRRAPVPVQPPSRQLPPK